MGSIREKHQEQKNQFGQVVGIPVENWVQRQKPSYEPMGGQYCRVEALDIGQHAAKLFEAFQWNNQDETWTYLPFGPFNTFGEFKKWLNQYGQAKMIFTIIDKATESPQGIAIYHDIDVDHGVIEVGSIHYSKLIQKSRAGTEAMYLMMHRAFEDLSYRRYQWRCNVLNKASRRAAERLGFKFEGIFRQSHVLKGHNRDTAWYSIIDCEWPALKEKFQKWLHPSNFDEHGQQLVKLQEIKLSN
jgi:RimJ/RimL family protein N-acetyltransferase